MIRPCFFIAIIVFLSSFLSAQKVVPAKDPVQLDIPGKEVPYSKKLIVPSKNIIEKPYSNVNPAGIPEEFPAGDPIIQNIPVPQKLVVRKKYHFSAPPHITPSGDWKFNDGHVRNITTMDVEQGFHSPNAGQLCIDQDANIWATSGGMGLNIYDGKNHYNFTSKGSPLENYLDLLAMDSLGNVWISGVGRLYVYNGKYFTEYLFTGDLKNTGLLRLFMDRKGILWIGTQQDVWIKHDGEDFYLYNWKRPAAPLHMPFITDSPSGAYWMTSDTGIVSFDMKPDGSGLLKAYRTESCFVHSQIREMRSDKKGTLWINSSEGLIRFDGRTFSRYGVSQGMHSANVASIYIDPQDRVWTGTAWNGVSMYDGIHFYRFDAMEGYASTRPVHSLVGDSKGNIWTSAFGDGLYRINQRPFSNYSTSQKIPGNTVTSILCVGSDSIWVGTNNSKLVCITSGEQRLYEPSNGFPDGSVRALMRDSKGNVWIGYWSGGAIKYDGKNFHHYTFGNNAIVAFCEDRSGNIWIGTSGDGVYCLEGNKLRHFSEKEGLPGRSCRRIFMDHEGSVWFNLYGAGVIKFEKGKFFLLSTGTGLTSKNISAIYEDSKHNMWFGTIDNGLSMYAENKFTHYTTENGLPNDKIWGIVEDQKGKVWFTTEKGISCGDWKDGKLMFQNFAWNDGVHGLEYYNNSIAAGTDGKLYFGSGKGMVVYDSKMENAEDPAPVIKINAVLLRNNQIAWNHPRFVNGFDSLWFSPDSFLVAGMTISDPVASRGITYDNVSYFYNLPLGLTLPWNENQISFSFIGNDWGDEHTVMYTYMLDGFDENWCAPVKKSDVEYLNLGHGDYIFRVKALNRYGKESDEAMFSFTIMPPWWKTWWCYSIEFLLGVALIRQFVRFREQALKRRNVKLEETVSLRTSELTNQKSLVETKNKEILDSINYAQRIQQAILHPEKEIRNAFADAFVIFRPKDIVSGDFYWFAESKYNKILAVADCTGHGVPGGFMSMLGYEILQDVLLQEAVSTTSEALSELDKRVTNTLNKSSKQHRDGMDMVLCAFSNTGNKLQYSGANRPLIHISEGEMNEYKPDKHTIGGAIDDVEKKFRNIEIETKKGDIFYLFTDGFADQFGGPKGKKFKYKNLTTLLKAVSSLPFDQQKQRLEASFHEWQGDLEQLDDVCMIGVKL